MNTYKLFEDQINRLLELVDNLDSDDKSESLEEGMDEKWSKSYKKSIDCSHPKGFSQKAHCAGRKKRQAGGETKSSSPFTETKDATLAKDQFKKDLQSDPDYKDFKKNAIYIDVNNKNAERSFGTPRAHDNDPFVSKQKFSRLKPENEEMDADVNEEKKKADRCLRIARRKYDKPSAYRSGAIVQCRRGKIWKGLSESDINDAPDEIKDLIYKAHDGVTKGKGKEYAPYPHQIQAWIDDHLDKETEHMDEAKKTDFTKEKKSGLHGWFSRRGGGGSKGWVDCNTCRKVDGKKKCKACGRQQGEKRSKYPSCRPTPASCGTPGKGKKWGKTKESVDEQLDRMKQIITL